MRDACLAQHPLISPPSPTPGSLHIVLLVRNDTTQGGCGDRTDCGVDNRQDCGKTDDSNDDPYEAMLDSAVEVVKVVAMMAAAYFIFRAMSPAR